MFSQLHHLYHIISSSLYHPYPIFIVSSLSCYCLCIITVVLTIIITPLHYPAFPALSNTLHHFSPFSTLSISLTNFQILHPPPIPPITHHLPPFSTIHHRYTFITTLCAITAALSLLPCHCSAIAPPLPHLHHHVVNHHTIYHQYTPLFRCYINLTILNLLFHHLHPHYSFHPHPFISS